jgi:polyisoprenoid-binding protein YceI
MRKTLSLCLLGLLTFTSAAAAGDGTLPLSVNAATLTINGTSTMHDYALSTTALTVVAAATKGKPLLQQGTLRSFELQIPVDSFTSEKDGLKEKMLETMKAERFPNIAFRLDTYEFETSPSGQGIVRAKGTVTVAGVEQPVELLLDVAAGPEGLLVRGTHPLSMKSFGIKPPTMFMGMLKTHDTVTIKFAFQLSPAANASN